MKKIILVILIISFIPMLSGRAFGKTQARGLYADGRQKTKTFQFFKWKVTVQDRKGRKEVIDTTDKLDEFIRTTDNRVIARERDRLQREFDRLEKRRLEKIERAEQIKLKEIEKAKTNAQKRIERANVDKQESIANLRQRLWETALDELKKEGHLVERK